MTNEIKTRRLIVTLPNTTGEEADQIAADAEAYIGDQTPGTDVRHALGETLPESVACWVNADEILLNQDAYTEHLIPRHLNPTEARQLAGVLLAHADTVELEAAKRRHPASQPLHASAAHSTPKTSSVSSGWYLHPKHELSGLRIRLAANDEIRRRYSNGRPVSVGVLIDNHRDEYDEIVREIARRPRTANLQEV